MTIDWPWVAPYLLLASTASLTNVAFVFVIVKQRHNLPVTAKILASLFVNGILSNIYELFIIIAEDFTIEPAAQKINTVYILLAYIFCVVSEFHLAAAAFERYVIIVYPFRHNEFFTNKRIWLAITSCYLLSIAVCSVTFCVAFVIENGNIPAHALFLTSCRFYTAQSIMVCLPGLLIVGFYIRVFLAAKSQRRKIAIDSIRTQQVSLRPILVLFVTATYSEFLWSMLNGLVYLGCNGIVVPHAVAKLGNGIPMLIMLLHPIVYGFGDRTMRKAFFKCFYNT